MSENIFQQIYSYQRNKSNFGDLYKNLGKCNDEIKKGLILIFNNQVDKKQMILVKKCIEMIESKYFSNLKLNNVKNEE